MQNENQHNSNCFSEYVIILSDNSYSVGTIPGYYNVLLLMVRSLAELPPKVGCIYGLVDNTTRFNKECKSNDLPNLIPPESEWRSQLALSLRHGQGASGLSNGLITAVNKVVELYSTTTLCTISEHSFTHNREASADSFNGQNSTPFKISLISDGLETLYTHSLQEVRQAVSKARSCGCTFDLTGFPRKEDAVTLKNWALDVGFRSNEIFIAGVMDVSSQQNTVNRALSSLSMRVRSQYISTSEFTPKKAQQQNSYESISDAQPRNEGELRRLERLKDLAAKLELERDATQDKGNQEEDDDFETCPTPRV
jgi:hypothetical protein